MDELESKKENEKDEKRRFSQEQYEILKRCSEKKDITEWNEWRKKHPKEKILLEGADLGEAYLIGANLQEADLSRANLQKAFLAGGNLQKAYLGEANLQRANLWEANLQRANLWKAILEKAKLWRADLQKADLMIANLQEANLMRANLQKAFLEEANLEKANLGKANLQGANFELAIVDGSTLIAPDAFDRFTNFTGVGLDSARVEPGAKQLFEYNIRRLRWEEWYKEHPKIKWVVKPFWLMSDYGLKTWRIIGTFLIFSLLFASVYANCAYWCPPGIVSNLIVEEHLPLWHYFLLLLLRPIYFSVVTMTTLGFGDMYANAHSIWGHILLSLQVILGYVLLGALVTRFAVLFTAGGPAGKFSNDK